MGLGLYNALALGAANLNTGGWSPFSLGADLLAWWTADDPTTLTLAGSQVTSWRDKKNGYDAAQAVSASRPVYSATGFNGAPGLSFDGTDDELVVSSQPFPSGNAGSSIYAVVQQNALVVNTFDRWVIVYGGIAGTNVRRVGRGVNAGANRARVISGNGSGTAGAVAPSGDFSGRCLVTGYFPASEVSVSLNDEAMSAPTAITQATGTTEVTIGATTFSTGFWHGLMRDVIVTNPLSSENDALMEAWALARRML